MSDSALILEIVEGPQAGRQVPLDEPIEIGRSPEASLTLADGLVSRHHARLEPSGGSVIVTDLESLNGTYLNENQIHSPAKMISGDHLLVGVTVFELRTRAQVSAQPSAVLAVPTALAAPAVAPSPPKPSPAAAPPKREAASPLDSLLDANVKKQTSAAPLAIFLLAVIVLSIFIATR